MMAVERKAGRYDRVEEATDPGPDLPRAPRRMRGKVETVLAAVPDPNPIMGERLKRQKVSVNRLCDPLECERSYGRISERAYLAGKAYALAVEPLTPPGPMGSGGGGGGCHELAIGYRIERAEAAVAMQAEVRRAIGAWAEMILRGVLADGHSFVEMAVKTRKRGESKRRARARVAQEFREALEDLGNHWDRVGWASP
jgi:hypothetical protein